MGEEARLKAMLANAVALDDGYTLTDDMVVLTDEGYDALHGVVDDVPTLVAEVRRLRRILAEVADWAHELPPDIQGKVKEFDPRIPNV